MYKNLDKLMALVGGEKTAFMAAPPMDPAMMGMPPGAPPMDPAMMGMPPGAPPMDPAMMGMPPGAPPMDPAMMGGAPPADPAAQTMADQEMLRTLIREEIQKAMGGGDAGQGVATGQKKGGNKFEDAIAQLRQQNEQQLKVIVAALRKAGLEIPLADIMGIESAGQQQPGTQGVSETLQPGIAGTQDGSLMAKAAEFDRSVAQLVKLAETRDSLKRSAMGRKLIEFDPLLPERNYFAGLTR